MNLLIMIIMAGLKGLKDSPGGVHMFPRWFIVRAVVATVVLSITLPVSAQESFLNEFRSVRRLQPDEASMRRPSFLASPDSVRDPDPHAGEISDGSAPAKDSLLDELPSRLHSASFEYEDHGAAPEDRCAEPEFDAAVDCETPLVRFRNGFYQGGQLNYGYIHDDPDSGLQIRTLDTSATFAVPLGSMENVIMFTPYYRADMLDAAAVLDVPDTLYDTGVKAFWRRPVNDRFTTMLLVTPSVRSDFKTSQGAFRLFGMGLLVWQAVPEKLAVSGGVVYTGRADYPVLPAMGLLWTPTPEWKFDFQFPSPRISYRFAKDGAKSETWAYLSGVFGGNTWAVTRASGAVDKLTISDLRLVSGVEHSRAGNRGLFAEVGYVFNRYLEYTDVPSTRDLDSTWMLRTGISF